MPHLARRHGRESMADVDHDDDALRFFNTLSGTLALKLSEEPKPISERMLNLAAPPTARLVSASLHMQVWLRESREFRELTELEWRRVVLRSPVIRMGGEAGRAIEHRAPDGATFTVRDLTAAIAETERQARGETDWFGGIDVHHVFFEGIELEADGVWWIRWGS
jgi:hypothetical protein